MIKKREDSMKILKIIKAVTGEEPAMWGDNIIGFGTYHYLYESGREADWMKIGFSPRKDNITIYIMSRFVKHQGVMAKLGKYKTGKSCLYLKNLEDIDEKSFRKLIKDSVQAVENLEIYY
jgi:hypothetical protein